MRFRLEPAPPRHVVTVVASLQDADPAQRRRIRLLTDESVDVAIEAIAGAFGVPADSGERLITPILRQYGRPNITADLGFGRRTLDARKHPLFDALAEVGALARLHRDAAVIDIEVESIAAPDPAATYPEVVVDVVDDVDDAGDRSSTTTERGPAS